MSLYSVRSGVDNHPEESFLQLFTDLVARGGVANVTRGDYAVLEATGLNVEVSAGRAYVKAAQARPIRNSATKTVAINPNSSGDSRITAIVAYVDLSVVPDPNEGGDDVHFLIAVDGTPSSSPSAPDNNAIQSAVGSNNPFIVLAHVLVADGATGIAQSAITDVRKRVFFRSGRDLNIVSLGSTLTPDYLLGDVGGVLTANLTINPPTNMDRNDWLIVRLVQGATPRTVTFSGITAMSPDISMPTASGWAATYAIHNNGSGFDVYLVGKRYT